MPIHNREIRALDGKLSPNGLVTLGAFFSVTIGVPPALGESLAKQGLSVPAPIPGLAMIDTGASVTCLDDAVACRLGLQPIGTTHTLTANGLKDCSIYQVKIEFPGTSWVFNPDGIPVTGVDLTGQQIPLHPNPQPLIALLGRDFLRLGILVYNGSAGNWSFAF